MEVRLTAGTREWATGLLNVGWWPVFSAVNVYLLW